MEGLRRMFKVTRIASEQVCPLLVELFATDSELVNQWHIAAGQGLAACAQKTASDLIELNCQVYKLTLNDEAVGYFAHEKANNEDFLTGFFLKPSMRTSEHKAAFFKVIKETINRPTFFAGVYSKNVPAVKFLQKHATSAREYKCAGAVMFTLKGVA